MRQQSDDYLSEKKGEKFNKKTNQREPTRAIIAEEFFAIP